MGAEFRCSSQGRLTCRDLSTNGTGIKIAADKQATSLEKNVDTPIPSGAVIAIPMLLKANLASTDRSWLKIELSAAGANRAVARSAPATNAGRNGDAQEGDAETNRMQFVELLLKTREINFGTAYEEAQRLLHGNSAWR